MKQLKPLKDRVQTSLALLIAAAAIGGLVATVYSAEPKTNSAPPSTNAVAPNASAPVVVKKQLTGAELYSIHCNRCHPERYPTERTAAQWKTIMLHMQIRASIPVKQAKLILGYLQENSGR